MQQQWKREWGRWVDRSLLIAISVHAVVFALWPPFEVYIPRERIAGPLEALPLPGIVEARLPAPLGELPRPALPEVEEMELSIPDDVAGPLPAFSPMEEIAPPSPPVLTEDDEWLAYQQFAPSMVRPEVRNRGEAERFLSEHYSPVLRRTGATGVARVLFWIDEDGAVQRSRIAQSSGIAELDRLALRLGGVLRFTPALRAGKAVRIRVILPVTFRRPPG